MIHGVYQHHLTRFTQVSVCEEPKLLPLRTAKRSTLYLVHYSSVVFSLPPGVYFDVQPAGTTTAVIRWEVAPMLARVGIFSSGSFPCPAGIL